MNPINFYSNFSNVENALNMVSNDVKNKIKLFYKNNVFIINNENYNNDSDDQDDNLLINIKNINHYQNYCFKRNDNELWCRLIEKSNNNIFIGVYSKINTLYKLYVGGQMIYEREIKKNEFQYIINENRYLFYHLLTNHDILIYVENKTISDDFYIIEGKLNKIDNSLSIKTRISYDLNNNNFLLFVEGMVSKRNK